jgi:hypothetical protein
VCVQRDNEDHRSCLCRRCDQLLSSARSARTNLLEGIADSYNGVSLIYRLSSIVSHVFSLISFMLDM